MDAPFFVTQWVYVILIAIGFTSFVFLAADVIANARVVVVEMSRGKIKDFGFQFNSNSGSEIVRISGQCADSSAYAQNNNCFHVPNKPKLKSKIIESIRTVFTNKTIIEYLSARKLIRLITLHEVGQFHPWLTISCGLLGLSFCN